ncbi:MAG TPA: hypothetical protein VJZ04_00130 [Lachnospiraceae bacterium]|nr:hypothetical protein [Lachnospiraceae bacterium]
MQAVFIILVAIFVFVAAILIVETKTQNKKIKQWIKDSFGEKPTKIEYEWDKVGYYWTEYGWSIPEDEKVDDVTWDDLELNNVFSRINNCNSYVGEQILYSNLHCMEKDNKSRELMEKKFDYFTSNMKEQEDIQFELWNLGKEEGSYYIPMFINNLDAFGLPGIWGFRMMQLLLVLTMLAAIIFQGSIFIFAAVGIFFINMVVYAMKKTKYEVNLDTLGGIIRLVKAANKIADTKKFAYEEEFHDLKGATAPFRKMAHMVGVMQKRKQASLTGDAIAIFYDYIIGATLWDFTRYNQIMNILIGKQEEFLKLFNTVGEIDMAISTLSFRSSLPFYCTPTFRKQPVLQMEKIYHPLIDKPVCNTVNLERSCLITGSNASGKSTFIKAITINIILAHNIYTCMATKMVIPYARIITSMAVRDDLMAGESYYIKEIKYLKRIIDNLSEERLVICAIDEILRGTNAQERIAASASILQYLHKKNCLAIVASHDIDLTKILEGLYDNFYFCEQIQENDIVFDYKIHDGITTSKNAIRLLEYVKFPKEIIEVARLYEQTVKLM